MKQEVIKFVQSMGGGASYSGKDKTLYIEDPDNRNLPIEKAVKKKFTGLVGGINFKVITNPSHFLPKHRLINDSYIQRKNVERMKNKVFTPEYAAKIADRNFRDKQRKNVI